MLLGPGTADWATIFSAGFAAVAAVAAFLTVLLAYRRESRSLKPWVAGTLSITPQGEKDLHLINVGLGAALGVRWAGVDIHEQKAFAGMGGLGLLAAGQGVGGPLGLPKEDEPLDESPFEHGEARVIWWCRDVERRLHFWSNGDDYVRYPSGHLWWKKDVPEDALDVFKDFFPEVEVPEVSAGDWTTV